MMKFIYIIQSFLGRIVLSGRFLVAILLFCMANYTLFHGMVRQMELLDYRIGPLELIPFYLSNTQSMCLYYLFFLFLVCAYPEWDGTQGEIIRLGRKWWIAQQLLYAGLTALIQYAALTLSLCIALGPRLIWNNQWSDLILTLCDTSAGLMGFQVNIAVQFFYSMVEAGSPLFLYVICFVLNLGGCMLVGTLTVILNIIYRRVVGTAVGAILISIRFFLEVFEMGPRGSFVYKAYQLLRYYLYPLYQTDLEKITSQTRFALNGRIGLSILYFIFMVGLILCLGWIKVKDTDLTSES